MRCQLTDKKIESLKGIHRRVEYRDTLVQGFGVRVTPEGLKSFFVTCRAGTMQKRITLGRYPATSLSEAREKARELLRLAAEGKLNQDEEPLTVGEVAELFIELHIKKNNRDAKTTISRFKNNFVNEYENRAIRDLQKSDIRAVLDKITARGADIQANRVLAAIKKFLNWCVERGYLDSNPAQSIKPPSKENKKDRVLSDQELEKILREADQEGFPFGPVISLLVLTGQRKSEVAGMRWSEIDVKEKMWSLPKERCKNGHAHRVPLSPQVIEILQNLPRFLHSDFVFTTTGTSAISGFGKIKGRIDDRSGVTGWTYHDLRRTAASGMARLEVPPHVIEKVLNHVSGSFSGVAGVYNRYGYEREKRAALELWASYIEGILNGKCLSGAEKIR